VLQHSRLPPRRCHPAVEISSLAELRPRHVWDIVDDAFDMYRERFALFGSMAAAIYVPALLITNLYLTSQYTEKLRSSQAAGMDPFGFWGVLTDSIYLTIPLFGVAYLLQLGATAGAVDDILRGENPTLKTALRKVFKRLFSLLGAALIVAIVITLSLCGVYIGLPLFAVALYSFFAQTVMVEGKSLLRAERRSRRRLAVANCYAASPQDAVDRFPAVRAVEVKGKPHFADFGLVPPAWGAAAAPWVAAAADGWPLLEEISFKRMVVTDDCLEMIAASFRNFQVLRLVSCEGFSTAGLAAIAAGCR